MSGYISLFSYGMKISNISNNSFTIKEVEIEYTYNGRRHSESSTFLLTGSVYSPHEKREVDSIIVYWNNRRIFFKRWYNIKSVLSESKKIEPNAIIEGSALFRFAFKDINEVKKVENLSISVTDYSRNKSVHPIVIEDRWIEIGRNAVVNPEPFRK